MYMSVINDFIKLSVLHANHIELNINSITLKQNILQTLP